MISHNISGPVNFPQFILDLSVADSVPEEK